MPGCELCVQRPRDERVHLPHLEEALCVQGQGSAERRWRHPVAEVGPPTHSPLQTPTLHPRFPRLPRGRQQKHGNSEFGAWGWESGDRVRGHRSPSGTATGHPRPPWPAACYHAPPTQVEQMFALTPMDLAGDIDYKSLCYIITHGDEKEE